MKLNATPWFNLCRYFNAIQLFSRTPSRLEIWLSSIVLKPYAQGRMDDESNPFTLRFSRKQKIPSSTRRATLSTIQQLFMNHPHIVGQFTRHKTKLSHSFTGPFKRQTKEEKQHPPIQQ